MKPRKHAAIIKAWADGAEIEYREYPTSGPWHTRDNPSWLDAVEYRIKPEPKPDVVERYFARSEFGCPRLAEHWEKANLKVTFDGDTGDLKHAEILK